MGRSPELVEEILLVTAGLTGGPVALVDDLSFSNRAVVVRIALGDGGTAIAKMPFEQTALTSELEAFRLLPADTRPALIGSARGILVMEDLGRGPSLADLLLGADRTPAEGAMHAWARTVGRALRATIRSGAPTVPLRLGEGLAELVGLAADLGVAVPVGVDDEVAAMEDALSAASAWLAYCPGDTCPDNNRVLGDGSVRLFDFEGSGWRHAATEAAYCRAPFCTCWCVAALPAGLTTAMENEFLGALDPPQPEEFRSAIAPAAVAWTLTTFDYFRPFVHHGGPAHPPPRAPIDGRTYVRVRLTAIGAEGERIPALAELAGNLSNAITSRWPYTAEVPLYPAFR